MEKQFFILIGRSGSGKGTQAALLQDFCKTKVVGKVIHITTGGGFREFIEGDAYIAKLAKEVNGTGGLQPEFLAVWVWSNIFINTLQGDETVIFDGAPRKPFEVSVLHSAIRFLGYEKPIVIYLDVPESKARENLITRGREDDATEESVAQKMSWFETDILPTLEVYRNDPRYVLLRINGDQSVEEVHAEIMQKLQVVH